MSESERITNRQGGAVKLAHPALPFKPVIVENKANTLAQRWAAMLMGHF